MVAIMKSEDGTYRYVVSSRMADEDYVILEGFGFASEQEASHHLDMLRKELDNGLTFIKEE